MLPPDWGPVYRLGHVVFTPNARALVSADAAARALLRHARFAWDSPPTQRSGRQLRLTGCRLLTAGRTADGSRFWILTEADRRLTHVLLPEEFPCVGEPGSVPVPEKVRSVPDGPED